MNLDWYSPVWGHHNGYGNAAEQMIRALERRGHRVGILEQRDLHFSGPVDRAWIRQHRPRRAQTTVYFTLPTTWMARAGRNVGFSMVEATALPDDWLPHLDRVDEIWVPSSFCAEVFGRFAARSIHVVPLGVDPQMFRPTMRPPAASIKFLHFAATHRAANKGAELAVVAFGRAFAARTDVSLVVQASVGAPPSSDDPRIRYTADAIPQTGLAAYFASFDALLYTSKGEGFGLIPLEATASGLPVFHSGQTGMRDYAGVGTVVPSREVPAVGQPGTWFEVDVDALAISMRSFADDPRPLRAKALADADTVRARWTWDASARAIEERLSAVSSSPPRNTRGASAR